MTEYWIISVPGEGSPQQTFEKIRHELTVQNNLGEVWKMNVPNDLKVGTLDTLVGLSDELGKLDTYAESVTHKVAGYMGEMLSSERHQLPDNLKVAGDSPSGYCTKFQWESAKYPPRQTLRGIFDVISEQVSKIDSELKTKSTQYNQLKGNLQTLERRQIGSLLTRNLGDIVKKEQFVLQSEFLLTLVVVVSNPLVTDWLAKYETLTDLVVPRSSECIYKDNEHTLFTVTLFRKIVDEFKNKCRENRFIVRDFSYNESEIEASKNELKVLESDMKKQFGPLFRWLKVNFGEAFLAMMHIKALRVFVESVLRYGLPVNFVATLIRPNKKMVKRLRETLNTMFKHLDVISLNAPTEFGQDIPGLNFAGADFFPYVYYKVDINYGEPQR